MRPAAPTCLLLLSLVLGACSSKVEVEALDGTVVVIETDTDEITDWSHAQYRSGDGMRSYGVSLKERLSDRGNEANMVGTTDGK